MPECSLVPNLIPCFLTFCSTIEFNPYLPLNFFIIPVYILYIWHSLTCVLHTYVMCNLIYLHCLLQVDLSKLAMLRQTITIHLLLYKEGESSSVVPLGIVGIYEYSLWLGCCIEKCHIYNFLCTICRTILIDSRSARLSSRRFCQCPHPP